MTSIIILVLSLVLACVFGTPAQAASCADDLKKVEMALQTARVPAEQKTQLIDMHQQAANLCAAGNETEAADVLAEAKSMLGTE